MISNEVKERLLQKDWHVHCQTKQESDLLLQACDEAGLRWSEGEKATGYCPQESYPFDIGIRQSSYGLYFDEYDMFEKSSAENITDWFFNKIKNNDSKLIPQNEEQEHLVQMLLAKLQGISVEHWSFSDQKWVDSTNDTIITCNKYRLKQEIIPTPLPISRELWGYIDKQWKYAAMDKNKQIFFYEKRPTIYDFDWGDSSYVARSPFNINTDGINWETSLTERPEDV